MRVKSVPVPPETVDRLLEIRDALPLVPEPEESCCERLVRRADLTDTETARDWLSFLRGLDLAAESSLGYHRTREGPDDSETSTASRAAGADGSGDLARALLEGVYGAREVHAILETAEGPLPSEEVFGRFDAVPRWERHRNPDWEAVWRERVERLLCWLALFGRVERVEDGYRVA